MSLIKYLNTRPLKAHFILNPNSRLSSVVWTWSRLLAHTINMAAVNHIRNRRSQRKRDVLEDIVARCLDGGDMVNIDTVVDMFENCNNNFDEKELSKLKSLGGSDQKISKFVYGIYHKATLINFCSSGVTS